MNATELIFSIVVPFLIYYVLLFALLEKIRFFNKRTNSLLSVLVSILGTYSLYKLGLSGIFPSLAAVFLVSIFSAVFFFGMGKRSLRYVDKNFSPNNSNNTQTIEAIKNDVKSICSEIIRAAEIGDSAKLETLKSTLNSKISILKSMLPPQDYDNFKKSLPQQCQALII